MPLSATGSEGAAPAGGAPSTGRGTTATVEAGEDDK
jgi:hypothetical protein